MRIVQQLWLLLLPLVLPESVDPKPSLPKHTSSNRNPADDILEASKNQSLSPGSFTFRPHDENRAALDDESNVGDDDVPQFETITKERRKRRAKKTETDKYNSTFAKFKDVAKRSVVSGRADDQCRLGNIVSSDVSQLRHYFSTCDNCLVLYDGAQCPLYQHGLELKKWILELQNLLSFGCDIRDLCGTGERCCHRRDVTTHCVIRQMTDMVHKLYSVFRDACTKCSRRPREGGWGEWGPWCECSASCGRGTRTRARACIRHPCSGRDTESQVCQGPSCCAWGQWGGWSACDRTCGTGGRNVRSRSCQARGDTANCRGTCPGSYQDYRPCSPLPACQGEGGWGEWGPWCECSASCGRGTRTRARTCIRHPCSGRDTESQVCQGPSCCAWGQWGGWSACDRTCGTGGRNVRSRSCQARGDTANCRGTCPGSYQDYHPCSPLPACQVEAQWSAWESWCACDCRKGIRLRYRQCRRFKDPPTANSVTLDVTRCVGIWRQQERCDVSVCPACLREGDCRGRVDGLYPSCQGCGHYARCQRGQMTVSVCHPRGTEWNHEAQKCSTPPSPTCTLVACVSSCRDLPRAKYPDCLSCRRWVSCPGATRENPGECPVRHEFHAHLQGCVRGRSPTCTTAGDSRRRGDTRYIP